LGSAGSLLGAQQRFPSPSPPQKRRRGSPLSSSLPARSSRGEREKRPVLPEARECSRGAKGTSICEGGADWNRFLLEKTQQRSCRPLTGAWFAQGLHHARELCFDGGSPFRVVQQIQRGASDAIRCCGVLDKLRINRLVREQVRHR